MVYPLTKYLFPFLRSLFVKECSGLKNIPPKGPFIIAANHQSHLDGFLIASYVVQAANQKVHFFTKREFSSYFGSLIEQLVYLRWAGALLVEKQGTQKKGKEAIATASALLDKGEIIGIFPEGTRTDDGSLLEGRTGIVRVILGTKKHKKIPIIPVGVRNAHLLLPRNCIIPRIWKTRVSLSFGKPFYIESSRKNKVTKKMLRTATTVVMKKISEQAGVSYDH